MIRETLPLNTMEHTCFIEITGAVNAVIAKHGVTRGLCCVYVPHTTAGVTINERADPAVMQDMIQALGRMVPWKNNYLHDEGNSAAHVKAALMGSAQTVIIEHARLLLGTWQGIFFAEFDGPRSREVWITITPDPLGAPRT